MEQQGGDIQPLYFQFVHFSLILSFLHIEFKQKCPKTILSLIKFKQATDLWLCATFTAPRHTKILVMTLTTTTTGIKYSLSLSHLVNKFVQICSFYLRWF